MSEADPTPIPKAGARARAGSAPASSPHGPNHPPSPSSASYPEDEKRPLNHPPRAEDKSDGSPNQQEQQKPTQRMAETKSSRPRLVPSACRECRRAHKQCSHTRPCQRCLTMHMECVPGKERKKRMHRYEREQEPSRPYRPLLPFAMQHNIQQQFPFPHYNPAVVRSDDHSHTSPMFMHHQQSQSSVLGQRHVGPPYGAPYSMWHPRMSNHHTEQSTSFRPQHHAHPPPGLSWGEGSYKFNLNVEPAPSRPEADEDSREHTHGRVTTQTGYSPSRAVPESAISVMASSTASVTSRETRSKETESAVALLLHCIKKARVESHSGESS